VVHAPVAAPGPVVIVDSRPAASVVVSSAIDASIAAYLAAGERMRIVARFVGFASVAVLVVTAVAWALGLLPGAVKLF